MSNNIVIFNQKGGVGKTLTTINLAGCLSQKDKNVLVVDCDSQANTTSCFMIGSEDDVKFSLADCVAGKATAEEAIVPCYINKFKMKLRLGVDLLPGSRDIDFVDFESGGVECLKKILDPVTDFYDYIIFDCSPQKTDAMIVAMCASDYVIVPAFAEMDSISGYGMVLDLVNDLKVKRMNETIEILGILINNVFGQNSLDSFVLDSLKTDYEKELFKTTIRHSTAVMQAKYFGMPVCFFKRSSDIAKDYMSFTNEVIKKIKERNRKVGV